ncbi:MAG TPA: alpha/beta hydrolase [Candidatus Limnocylindria bacterium]|nr:alpha/beta hydrolase [Candidatus Limnocylindria bacterium]
MDPTVLERQKQSWRPRFLANGIEPYDYETTIARVQRFDQWLPEWTRTADGHVSAADDADSAGHRATAAGHRRLAALCLHFGHFNAVRPVDAWLAAQKRKAALYRQTLEYLDPPAERVEIPFEAITLPAHLRKPRGVQRPPVALFFSGLDSTKEEHATFEAVLLERGLATLTFDGPGQGEVWERMGGRVDWERAGSAVVDFAAGRPDLDPDRIVALGVSLGGYFAPRCAALEPRIKAVAAIGGRFDQEDRDLSDDLHGPRFLHYWKAATPADAAPYMKGSTLAGVIEKLDRPLLVVHGAKDNIAAPDNAKRMADRAPHARWILFADGNHVCNNIPHIYRPIVADWLADQVRR